MAMKMMKMMKKSMKAMKAMFVLLPELLQLFPKPFYVCGSRTQLYLICLAYGYAFQHPANVPT